MACVFLTVGLSTSNVDADIFNLWFKHDLIPKLPPTAVLVMDNATFHKRAYTQAIIKENGHILEYLPAYNPQPV